MTFRHPFQKLCFVHQKPDARIVLAATGPVICSISIDDGKLLNQWPSNAAGEDQGLDQELEDNAENGERPTKRRKTESVEPASLSQQPSDGSDESLEIVAERKKGERRRPKVVDSKLPNVSHLLATRDAKHVVAVTAEDKSVKVFELLSSGRLQLLSQRSLPKRLCAIQLTADETTMLAADKFGDVYSLPLHPSRDYIPKIVSRESEATFSPSATELTVHTKMNREALRQQMEQKKMKQPKEGPDFEHRLLLGHVSLLTDLIVAEGDVAGRKRPYILTADRDEHIRVSRGIPQAHVIETYCLGHQEFVSKLCIPPWAPDVLIAGNGEPSLRIFKWQTGEQIKQFDILGIISEEMKRTLAVDGRNPQKLAVSGLWPLERPENVSTPGFKGRFLFALEGIPILFDYYLTDDNQLWRNLDIDVQGNVLDVRQMRPREIVVSLDTVHKAMSVKTGRSDSEIAVPPLQVFVDDDRPQETRSGKVERIKYWREVVLPEEQLREHLSEVENPQAEAKPKTKAQETKAHEKPYSHLGEFLYGLENLRKKRDAMAEDDTEEAADAGELAIEELNVES